MSDRRERSFPADTLSVSELGGELQAFLGQAFQGVWVGGELQRPRPSRGGHLYFQLVEKGSADQILGSIDAVVFRRDHQRVQRLLRREGVDLQEGQLLRCFGNVDFYPPFGRLQFVVRDIDPLFTLGDLARRRRETLAELERLDLLRRNAQRELPAIPLRIGLVTSWGSAACEDFLATLRASTLGFEIRLADVAVQGPWAEGDLLAALQRLERLGPSGMDAIAVVRGGGSRAELATFDSRAIAERIAAARVPVLTGLGHQIDQSIADLVAHTAFKTPTAVAEFLCHRVFAAERVATNLATQLQRLGQHRSLRARQRVERALGVLRGARAPLAAMAARLEGAERQLHQEALQRLLTARRSVEQMTHTARPLGQERLLAARRRRRDLHRRLVGAAGASVREQRRFLESLTRLTVQLGPETILQRGFSHTVDAEGKTVRSAAELAPGDALQTTFAEGSAKSRVEEVGR